MEHAPEQAPCRVVIAPDSFKGCLGSREVSGALAVGVLRASPGAQIQRVPMADGGEGTVAAVAAAHPAAVLQDRTVSGPYGQDLRAPLLWLRQRRLVVLELASAAGLESSRRRDPMCATTRGVGQLIAAASRGGATRLLVGAGGSATLDGGAGALQALGVSLLDANGQPIGPGLLGLEALDHVRPSSVELPGIEILCDVQSPLLGPRGAARLFGPQKGATDEVVERAEVALERYAVMLTAATGRDPRTMAGAGAAGGFAAGMWSALGASLGSGFEVVADLVGLPGRIAAADLVITGEGCVDGQTGEGKLVARVQAACASAGVPLAVVAGQTTEEGRAWCRHVGATLVELGGGAGTVEERIRSASTLLELAGVELIRDHPWTSTT